MRRALGCLVVVVMLFPALTAMAHTENVRDDFGAVSFSGNDGSLDWSGSWTEGGESDGPGSGQIRVAGQGCSNNNCLQMRGGLLGQISVRRGADLTTFTNASFEFDLHIDPALLSTGTLSIQARGNGSGWQTLESWTLLLAGGESFESFDISSYLGSDFEVRFALGGLLGGDRIYFDRVNIEGAVEATTTTSTTSTSSTSTSTISSSSSSTSSTSTSSTSTSSTSSTSTSSPAPSVNSTSSTSTTTPRSTTSTASPGSSSSAAAPTTTSTVSAPVVPEDATTTTDASSTTTTENPESEALTLPSPPGDGGLRQPAVGLLADYRPGMMGDLGMEEIEVLGAELDADFSLAVEAFEAARVWIAVLALLITAATVSGMDRKRSRKKPIL